MKPSIFVLIALLALSSCSKNSNPVNTIDFGDETNAIFLSSFESNGDTTLSGWSIPIGFPTNHLSFSRDVPIGGGYWSLNIRGIQGAVTEIQELSQRVHSLIPIH